MRLLHFYPKAAFWIPSARTEIAIVVEVLAPGNWLVSVVQHHQ